MHSEKSINSFVMIKSIGYLIINWLDFFYQFLNNFSALLLCKINVFDIHLLPF